MHITGLLLWRGLQRAREPISTGLASPLQQQCQKACYAASNISFWCHAQLLEDFAEAFLDYSRGEIISTEDLFNRASPPIWAHWFPNANF